MFTATKWSSLQKGKGKVALKDFPLSIRQNTLKLATGIQSIVIS
jgi:hypothetical protein